MSSIRSFCLLFSLFFFPFFFCLSPLHAVYPMIYNPPFTLSFLLSRSPPTPHESNSLVDHGREKKTHIHFSFASIVNLSLSFVESPISHPNRSLLIAHTIHVFFSPFFPFPQSRTRKDCHLVARSLCRPQGKSEPPPPPKTKKYHPVFNLLCPKAVIVKCHEAGTKDRKYPHLVVAGVDVSR